MHVRLKLSRLDCTALIDASSELIKANVGFIVGFDQDGLSHGQLLRDFEQTVKA